MSYDNRIVQFLSRQTAPIDVEKIRVAAGIGNWNTALKHLLELYISSRISGQKTSKGWIFWKKGADAA